MSDTATVLDLFDDGYPPGFWYWLKHNNHIYHRFEKMALQLASAGRERYSARTLVEVIRWNTDLEDTEATFKINGNYVPGMARLWMETHGMRYPKFFELRY